MEEDNDSDILPDTVFGERLRHSSLEELQDKAREEEQKLYKAEQIADCDAITGANVNTRKVEVKFSTPGLHINLNISKFLDVRDIYVLCPFRIPHMEAVMLLAVENNKEVVQKFLEDAFPIETKNFMIETS